MRKLFLQLLLFAITISVYGTDLYTKPDTIYSMSQNDEGEWVYSSRECFIYYDNGEIKETEKAAWSNFYKDWVNEDRYVYSTSDSPKMERTEKYSWSLVNKDWKLSYVNRLEYDADGNLLVDEDGQNGSKKEYIYENGEKVKYSRYERESGDEEWKTYVEHTWTYNDAGLLIDDFLWEYVSWKDEVETSRTKYEYEGKELVKRSHFNNELLEIESTFSYRNDTLVEVFRAVDTTGEIVYSCEKYKMYDQDGRLLWEEDPTNGVHYELEEYFSVKKIEYTYNENGKVIKDISKIKNEETGLWVDVSINEKQYDEKGNVKTVLYYRRNAELGEMELQKQFDYTYNDDGKLVKETQQYLDNDNATLKALFENAFTYHENGQLKDSVGRQYISLYNSLIDIERKTYNEDGELESSMKTKPYAYDRNSEDGTFSYDSTVITYGYPFYLNYEEYFWDSEKQQMVGELYQFHVDEKDTKNKTSYYAYMWNKEKNDLVLYWSRETHYDENGYPISDELSRWDYYTGEYESTRLSKYENIYPSQNVTALVDTDIDVKIYPTIATNQISIAFESIDRLLGVKVLNTHGQIVCSFSILQNELDITDWALGKYYILFETNNSRITKSFVKK